MPYESRRSLASPQHIAFNSRVGQIQRCSTKPCSKLTQVKKRPGVWLTLIISDYLAKRGLETVVFKTGGVYVTRAEYPGGMGSRSKFPLLWGMNIFWNYTM